MKKIIISIVLFSLLMSAGGIYIIAAIQRASDKLENIVRLHQIEILREQLLLQIKRAQADLYLRNTRYERGLDTIVGHMRSMGTMVDGCFKCHHEPGVRAQLSSVRSHVEEFKSALSRVYTIRANSERLKNEEDTAYKTGIMLLSEMSLITAVTGANLEERTRAAIAEVSNTRMILFTLLVTTPLVVIGLSIVFLRKFTRPVNALLQATRRLKGGDLDHRIPKLQDEYGEVAESFNEMAASLKEEQRKMQWAEQLFLLGEMSGGLAHEIKNPLAGVKASLEVLVMDAALPAEDRDILAKSIEQIKKIETLLKNLLNFARPPKPQFMPVNVNDVLNATIALAQRLPLFTPEGGKGVSVVLLLDPRVWEIMADPLQLQQVFMNLLINAAEAMPQGGAITVRTAYEPATRVLQVSVTDTGEGVDPDVVEKIFRPFYTTKSKGSGLGLSITKRLVEQHGGSIRAVNNLDRGVSFLIDLPVMRKEAPVA